MMLYRDGSLGRWMAGRVVFVGIIGRVRPVTVLHSMRLRVLGVVIGLTLCAIGVLSWMALPVLPVVGFAVATAALVVNSMTSRLSKPLCRDCGLDLSNEPTGPYGVACSECGRINQIGSPQNDEPVQDESLLTQSDATDQNSTSTGSESPDSLV